MTHPKDVLHEQQRLAASEELRRVLPPVPDLGPFLKPFEYVVRIQNAHPGAVVHRNPDQRLLFLGDVVAVIGTAPQLPEPYGPESPPVRRSFLRWLLGR